MANTNANITNKLFTYVSHGVDINEDIKEIYQNSLIFIGDEGQIYIPMYNTYIGIGNSRFSNIIDSAVWEKGENTASIQSRDTGAIAKGNYSLAHGKDTRAFGDYSEAGGFESIASGDKSTAIGDRNIALGNSAFAQGSETVAYGICTHAEGISSYAYGKCSHTEGQFTAAYGVGSHAEGQLTTANGDYSHTEGFRTIAAGDFSHVEGQLTTANGDYSHAEGFKTIAIGDFSHVEGSSSSEFDIIKNNNLETLSNVINTWDNISKFNMAYGFSSHSEGKDNISGGSYSHSEGLHNIAFGSYSHASGKSTWAGGDASTTEGINTKALGYASHAEGFDTTASGESSHSEGKMTLASGINAHAEGSETSATYNNAHAEGYQTHAINIRTHAEGSGAIASGEISHAEGYDTVAKGNVSHAEGLNTTANGNVSHTEGHATITGFAADDETGDRYIPTPDDDNSLGHFAHAEGNATTAYSANTHAEGRLTFAKGLTSHAEGNETISSGETSHAEGNATISNGVNSHTEGLGTITYGNNSHAEGRYSQTGENAHNAHAEGQSTQANGNSSHTEGRLTIANGDYSHAEGYSTYANGSITHAEGHTTYAIGEASHAEGQYTYTYNTATGSHVEGFNTYTGGNFETNNLTASLNTSRGVFAHAEGNATIAKGPYSHSEGKKTFAKGQNSHAEGDNTVSEGIASHAEGDNTLAYGNASHAEGTVTAANGNYSHTEGVRTIANNEGEHAEGKYNLSTLNKTIHSVGIGTDTNARKNAFEILNDGTSYIINLGKYTHSVIPYYDGTNLNSAVSVQELINTHFEDGLLINQLDPRGNSNFTYAIVGINTYTSTDNQHKISYQILPLPTKKYVDDLIEANDALRYCGTVTPASAANGNITLSHYQTEDDPELVNPGHHTKPDTSRGAVYKVSSTGYIGLEYVKAGDMIISYQDNAVANTYVGWDVINENLHLITIEPTQAYNPTQNRVLTNVHLTDDGTFSYTYYPLTVQNNQPANNNLAQQSTGGSAFIQQTDLNRLHDVTNIGIPVLTAVKLTQTNLTTELSYSYTYIYTNQGHHTYNVGEDTEAGNNPSYVALDMNPFNVMTGISISYDGKISYSYTPVVILDAEHSHGADQGELSYGLNYIKGSTGDTTGVITELYLSSYVDPISGETHVNTLSYAYTNLSGFEGHTSSNGKDFVISYTQNAKGKISVEFGTFTYENTAVANASHYMSNDSYKFITNVNINHDGKLSYQVIDVTITDSYTYNDVQTVNDTPRKFLPTGIYPANKNARSFSYLYDETFAYTYVYTKNNMKYSYQFFNGSEVLNGNSYIFGKVVIKSGDGLGGSVAADLDVGNNAIIRNDASIYGDASVSKNLSVTNSVELAKTHLTATNVYSYGVTYLGAKKPSGVSTYWTYVMGSTTIGSDNADYVYLTSRHIDLSKASTTAKVEFSGLNLLWGTI